MPDTRIADSATTSSALIIATPLLFCMLDRRRLQRNASSFSDQEHARDRQRQIGRADRDLMPVTDRGNGAFPNCGTLRLLSFCVIAVTSFICVVQPSFGT